uniref:Homeobox domain-containing protein n=1 Tax=Strongyloides venezuelensis TaxID=75913 RepID=A0A0K0FKH9_STRVS
MNIINHNTLGNVHEIIAIPFDIFDNKKVQVISNEERGTLEMNIPNCETFTNKDHKLLEEFFRKNEYPNLKEKHDLAIHLNSSPVKIQTWFQNQRAKRKNETNLCALKKNRISQTVEDVIVREMKKVENPNSEIKNESSNFSTTTINGTLSYTDDSDKEKKHKKDVFKKESPAFVYGLWYGLNLFFGNASPEAINQFLNEDKSV